ncbi:hypothetical protein MKX08_009587 [Trichoderma sp. CBMAI-0020]|nr:hypothetical protein MKX08_009587 [Trichoderma sp. CBMAI-0020]
MTGVRSNACYACAKAKRKCTKQVPSCLRCGRLDLECIYPAAKPGSYVMISWDTAGETDDGVPGSSTGASLQQQHVRPATPSGLLGITPALDFADWTLHLVDESHASTSFTAYETWVSHLPRQPDVGPFNQGYLQPFISVLNQWLSEWCAQDAYSALTCYLNKTGSNNSIVMHLLEEKCWDLVTQIDVPQAHTPFDDSSPAVDLLEKLAKVQSLLIYQVVGLFDGNIRLRYLAEKRIALLKRWMNELVEDAYRTSCSGSVLVSADVNIESDMPDSQNALWYSWILSESIRRTWIIASGVQGLYLYMQQGFTKSCQGGMMFTTRQGVWEAQSASAWDKIYSEPGAGLTKITELDKLLTEGGPNTVDNFAKVVLMVTLGTERVAAWNG